MKCKEELKELVNLNLKICGLINACELCPMHHYGSKDKDLCDIMVEISEDLEDLERINFKWKR